MNPSSYFASSYQNARQLYQRSAADTDAYFESHVIPDQRGLEGEELATDVVWLGPQSARRLLVLTSGTHGVEGFCGSAAQVALLHDRPLHALLDKLNVAILVVHAINPYGFSHLSRTNEDNVDLNRNSIDFSKPLPVNPAYDDLHALLVPQEWPPSQENAAAIAKYIEERGESAYQQALTIGQYRHADGMFFGGARTVWSTRLLQTLLKKFGTACDSIGWIDFHTGLGPYGHGEKICVGQLGAQELQRARAWWGADVTSPLDGTSVAANVAGPVLDTLRRTCTHARTTAIAIEYGTVPLVDMLHRLRADSWVRQHPDADPRQIDTIRAEIRAGFYCEDDVWRGLILGQARAAILQAVMGLSRDAAA
ncbi:M14 family metallopeptidase [Paraburkholderia sp. ZP32-5]|uniref:M14 family metallopeptidase n=1 Tax=Paraburkholderia sp. ZP32-5 TaxID=2883245 RepID=UPI001F1D1314|nr:M14 family metallopeptidase [Paraburkholderia sp. ZP32-5]